MRKSNSRGAGANRSRAPRIDSSRRPKPKKGRSTLTTNQRRAAAKSVFAAPNPDAKDDEDERQGRRLQQVLAAAGYGSRRQCEELIVEGRVEIDGEIVTELGVRVKPFEQKIRVDGEAMKKSRPTYVAFNKPKNALCTNRDPSGRRLAIDFIPPQFGRLFPVGRLDQNSEGLLLLTNDGALAERLAHPRYETPKKYRVQVAGLVDQRLVDDLKRGVHIAEGVVQADEVVIKSRHKLSSILEITLTEGKNREIRRMLARVGHKVMQLQRVQIGSIKLGELAPGEFRLLDAKEVAELYRIAESRSYSARNDAEPRRSRPVELAEVQEREEEKELAREKAKKREENAKKSDPFYSREVKAQFKRSTSPTGDVSARRRAPREEFREEFRDEERANQRRRTRREYDDETRTIGPKKFDRSDDRPDRGRFNDDASKRRRAPERERENGPRRGAGRGQFGGKSNRKRSGR